MMDQGPHTGRERRDLASRQAFADAAAMAVTATAGSTITAVQVPALCGLPTDVGARILSELVSRRILLPLPGSQVAGGNRWGHTDAFRVQRTT